MQHRHFNIDICYCVDSLRKIMYDSGILVAPLVKHLRLFVSFSTNLLERDIFILA